MTYGPVTGDTGSTQPPSARVGLLAGLVVVLLVICGGIAFTGYRFAGPEDSDRSAATGPNWDPPVRTAGPDNPTRIDPATPSVPASPPAAVPTGKLAGGPIQGDPAPFGPSGSVVWPDDLEAMVYEEDSRPLPAGLAAKYPGAVEAYVWVFIDNNTPNDLTIPRAQVQLWYGPSQTPAVQFSDPGDIYDGISGFVESGGTLWGDATFVVPPQYLSQLVFQLRPRPGDKPGRFYGSAKE